MHLAKWGIMLFEKHYADICIVPVYQRGDIALQVARCTKIINPGTDEAKYVINVKQIAKVSHSSDVRQAKDGHQRDHVLKLVILFPAVCGWSG